MTRIAAHVPHRRGPIVAVAAAVLIIGAAAGGAIAATTGGYPHPWCGAVVTAETARHGTEGSLEGALSGAQDQGAPVGQLLSDLAAYDTDAADANGASGVAESYTALPRESGDLRAAGADLQSLARQCGLPAGDYKKWDV